MRIEDQGMVSHELEQKTRGRMEELFGPVELIPLTCVAQPVWAYELFTEIIIALTRIVHCVH